MSFVSRQSEFGDFGCAEQLKSVDLYGGGPIGAGAGDRVCRSKCTAIIREKCGQAVYRPAREAQPTRSHRRAWGRSEVGGVEGRNEITARIKNQSEIYPGDHASEFQTPLVSAPVPDHEHVETFPDARTTEARLGSACAPLSRRIRRWTYGERQKGSAGSLVEFRSA